MVREVNCRTLFVTFNIHTILTCAGRRLMLSMKTCRRCCWRPRSATLPSTFMSTKHPKVNFYFSDFLARSLCCTHTRGKDYAGLMKPSDTANGMHPPAHATSQTPHANLSAGINNLILTLSHQISILSSSATPLLCCAECENFLKLCKVKYYNFSPFHRVVKDFIAQTGDPLGSGKGGKSIWGYANTPVCLCACVCVCVRMIFCVALCAVWDGVRLICERTVACSSTGVNLIFYVLVCS